MASTEPGTAARVIAHSDLDDFAASDAADGITFLNEVAGQFPDAISFAAGRPHEDFMSVDDIARDLDAYRGWLARHDVSTTEARARILQYGPAVGIINDLIADHLAKDENIEVEPTDVLVTNGASEALWLTLATVMKPATDELIVVTPNYPGVWGAARSLKLRTQPAHVNGRGGLGVVEAAQRTIDAGMRPRALYVSSDSGNPTGVSLTDAHRAEVLDAAHRLDMLVIEDNPYSLVAGPVKRLPSLKSLDTDGRVVRLGSFSKSIFPGLRVGYAVADSRVQRHDGRFESLAVTLSRLKAVVTVNTSPVAQALVAGRLIANDLSLRQANRPVRQAYRRNRRAMVAALERHVGSQEGVSWRVPDSGFFMQVDTDFPLGDHDVATSAGQFGVLWTPLTHFYGEHPAPSGMRLAYSYTDPDEIDRGIERLARFLRAARANEGNTRAG